MISTGLAVYYAGASHPATSRHDVDLRRTPSLGIAYPDHQGTALMPGIVME
jgi:hypothetical protein